MTANPFQPRAGARRRVAYARDRLAAYGRAPYDDEARRRATDRRFDNCFEENDGDFVMWELRALVHAGDRDLAAGMALMWTGNPFARLERVEADLAATHAAARARDGVQADLFGNAA